MTEMYVIFYKSCLPYYYSIFPSRWNQGSPFWHICRRWWYRALSLQLTVLPMTAVLSVNLLISARSNDKIFAHDYTEIVSSLKCTWYFCFIFAWISSLPYTIIVLFPFSHWKQGIVELTAFSSLLASWFVIRQIVVPPVGLSAWRSFVFRCSISKIFTPDFTVIHTSLECTWYLYIIVFYSLIISLSYYCSSRFLL